jgi:tetratricopeptide (TPR) repeat protein
MNASRPALALILGCLGCHRSVPLPPQAVELNRTGVEALAQGNLEAADTRFALALEYSPRFVEALTNLGLVEVQRGNFERAEELLDRARSINPDVAQPHHGLGVLAERRGLPDQAADHYRDALAVDPGFAPARSNLARLCFNSNQLEQARIEFSKLVEASPRDPLGHAGLIESLLGLGRIAEADGLLDRAHEQFPESGELEILWCRGLLRAGNAVEAARRLARLGAKGDDLAVRALGWLGTAELARGRPRHAVGAARRALALDRHDPVAVYAMAMALAELDDPAAMPWLERALASNPTNPELRRALGRLRRAKSRPSPEASLDSKESKH